MPQVDFTNMLTHNKLRYLLTLVDTFTEWIEVFPASREMADVVAQVLLDHIILSLAYHGPSRWTMDQPSLPGS